MLIEQYELRFTHQIIDTKKGKVLEKLGTYYTTIFNELPNIFVIPKTEIYERLLHENDLYDIIGCAEEVPTTIEERFNEMIIEQYELRFIHKIIDTEQGKDLGKLEPDYTTVFNVIANNYDIPKIEIYERLLYEMEKGLMKNVK